jgi:hypothetical protein
MGIRSIITYQGDVISPCLIVAYTSATNMCLKHCLNKFIVSNVAYCLQRMLFGTISDHVMMP